MQSAFLQSHGLEVYPSNVAILPLLGMFLQIEGKQQRPGISYEQ
jgi:hypothetical protein